MFCNVQGGPEKTKTIRIASDALMLFLILETDGQLTTVLILNYLPKARRAIMTELLF